MMMENMTELQILDSIFTWLCVWGYKPVESGWYINDLDEYCIKSTYYKDIISVRFDRISQDNEKDFHCEASITIAVDSPHLSEQEVIRISARYSTASKKYLDIDEVTSIRSSIAQAVAHILTRVLRIVNVDLKLMNISCNVWTALIEILKIIDPTFVSGDLFKYRDFGVIISNNSVTKSELLKSINLIQIIKKLYKNEKVS